MTAQNPFHQSMEEHAEDVIGIPTTVNLHASEWTLSDLPEVGDTLEGCQLIAELGHGSSGRVFLAQQAALAERPIVLKITNGTHEEHLNLARLQHTHIMPLFWESAHPFYLLRILAMPYLAKTTLSRLLERLSSSPIEQWNGARVFDELQKDQEGMPVRIAPQEHAADVLKGSTWIEFVLRIGQILAEALDFAHRRGLLHLDVKPSNILITPDGQPILLDLDVARQPIAAGTSAVTWFGGTPAYMSPEQKRAMEALSCRKPIPDNLDERSDVYLLGMVLYEALGGKFDDGQRPDALRLPDLNTRVSREIAEMVAQCTTEDPAGRYATCAALATDLDRQSRDLPLVGIRECWSNRWRKWRRRRPLLLPLVLLGVSFCAAVCFAGASIAQINSERRGQAEAALLEGHELQRLGQYEAAVRRFSAGKDIAAQTSGGQSLYDELSRRTHSAQRLQQAQQLESAVRLMRYGAVEKRMPRRLQHVLEAAGRSIWAKRGLLVDRSARKLEDSIESRIDSHLQEFVVLWCDLKLHLAPPTHRDLVRGEVQKIIEQAELLFPDTFAIHLVRTQHLQEKPRFDVRPSAAWEHCALGRLALGRSDYADAEAHFHSAWQADPFDPACSFHSGVLALRQKRFADALQSFSYSLGMDPEPETFVMRGEAYAALGQNERALRDFQQALSKNPQLGHAYQLRGNLYEALGRTEEAKSDWKRAEQLE